MIWQAERDNTCKGCGHPIDETTDPDAEDTYTAHKIKCFACAARDRRASDSTGQTFGIYYRTAKEG